MKLIVGLGNPTKEYEQTRHNVGFMALDNYLVNENWKNKFSGIIAEKIIGGEKYLFLKPSTYMNNSGLSVQDAVSYYNIPLDNVFVIHDDLDLDCGKIKIKYDSSDGGHNGIKSIINSLSSKKFVQIKVGISTDKNNIVDYVLGKFSKNELSIIDESLNVVNNIITDSHDLSITELMNKYN